MTKGPAGKEKGRATAIRKSATGNGTELANEAAFFEDDENAATDLPAGPVNERVSASLVITRGTPHADQT